MKKAELMMVEPLFQVAVTCTNCENSFQSSRVRPSFKKAKQTDSDFCVHYKEINPNYYVVRICPFCGFASTESFSNKMTMVQKNLFNERVATYWSMREYGGERTWEDALQSFKLALLCAQIKEESSRVVAGILHHIAWLYRYNGVKEQENRFLQFALDAYVSVYEKEGMDLNNAKLMFLIGELSRRLKHYGEAIKWFARIINDRKIVDAAMIRAAREQWVVTREDMLADKLELPEEMQKNA
jgi:uncharacterized protein (DUF2225 family)